MHVIQTCKTNSIAHSSLIKDGILQQFTNEPRHEKTNVLVSQLVRHKTRL